MTPAMRRGTTEVIRTRNATSSLSRLFAVLLLVAALFMGGWVIMHDADWKVRNRSSASQAMASAMAGDMHKARAHFETAVAADPYDWRTHRRLAELLATRIGDRKDAVRHYSLALAYAPATADMRASEEQLAILQTISAGIVENPTDCLEDMRLAAEAGMEEAFRQRLSPSFVGDPDTMLRELAERGRGIMRRCEITAGRSGEYRAETEVEFSDNSRMTVAMICRAGEVWRVGRILEATEN